METSNMLPSVLTQAELLLESRDLPACIMILISLSGMSSKVFAKLKTFVKSCSFIEGSKF